MVCEPNIFKTGPGQYQRKKEDLHPRSYRSAQVIFSKIYLCLLSVGQFFYGMMLPVKTCFVEAVFTPHPVNKVKYRFRIYFWKVNIVLFKPVLHLGRGSVRIKFQPAFYKGFIRYKFLFSFRSLNEEFFILPLTHGEIFGHCSPIKAKKFADLSYRLIIPVQFLYFVIRHKFG